MLLRGSIGALWRRTWHGAGIKLRRDTLGVSLCGFTAHTRGQSDYIEAAKGRTCGSPFAQYNEARATGPTQGAAGGRSVTYGWNARKRLQLRRYVVAWCFYALLTAQLNSQTSTFLLPAFMPAIFF